MRLQRLQNSKRFGGASGLATGLLAVVTGLLAVVTGLLAVAIAWAPLPVQSQDTPPAPPGATETRAEADRGTRFPGSLDQPRNLARDRYVDRQRATLEMWRLRTQSRQAVQDAARHPDPEVAERAAWILKQWRSASLPGVAQGPAELLLDRGNPSALASVLEQGAFDAVLVAVEESAGTIEFDQIKQRVVTLLSQRYPFYCDKAFAAGTEADLLNLLDAVAIDRNVATAWRDLKHYLHPAEPKPSNDAKPLPVADSLPAADSLPTAASLWSPAERATCLAQFAMLRGDVDQAIAHARATGDPVVLRIARMLGDRWGEIADDAFENAKTATTPEARIEAYAWALAATARTGDQVRFDLAQSQLSAIQPNEPDALGDLRWRALAMHARVDQAIDVMAARDPAAAAKVACAASRFRRAEQLCGYPLEQIASDLDGWIKDAYVDQANLPAGSIAPSIERLYSLARLLVNIGDTDNALRIYRRLTPRQVIISPYGASLREQTLVELDLINRFDWMLDIAVAPGENAMTQRSQYIIAQALNTESEAFRKVLDRINLIRPATDFRERFRITFQLFRGKQPDGFGDSNDFKSLLELLLHDEQSKRSGGRTLQVEQISLDLDIVDMFIRQGQVELAREGLAALTRARELDALISSAETETEQGDNRAAEELWQQVARQSAQYTPTNALITVDHGLSYAKSIVGSWILAKRAGHHEIADQLESRLRLMLTSPSMNFRKELADHLRQTGQHDLAVETLRELAVSASFGGEDAPDFFRVAVTYVGLIEDLKETHPAALNELQIDSYDAVKWSDLAVLGLLKTARYHDTAFISVPLSVRKTFLQHAIETADESLARHAIEQIESYDPINIDYGERMLPELRKAGLDQLADSAFDRLIDHGLEQLRHFRTDATALNNLAWAAAMNERRLDEALELSERAVLLEPDSVIYRDTLAEVLYLLGRTQEALAIESACLLDEPDEWHLHEQIEKYRKLLQQ
ncbi:hypothetical protein NZK35_31625 [Stieleria sp. ICT_E10.1]|uniref:hypothetical protein n=1 Tax=Stieleria sedimenti TaxID=2976331 RepID=UPI00217F4017|nr:hypothetical protein [Stieleria sedimenti]MCS7471230.1 hypothetical protein [Stieleria sedimenti]